MLSLRAKSFCADCDGNISLKLNTEKIQLHQKTQTFLVNLCFFYHRYSLWQHLQRCFTLSYAEVIEVRCVCSCCFLSN